MTGTFYDSKKTRTAVLEHLRSHPKGSKAVPIAMALNLPLWVVGAALDSAVLDKLVRYDPLVGYLMAPVVAGAAVLETVPMVGCVALKGGVA
jgi:hypothetical protein